MLSPTKAPPAVKRLRLVGGPLPVELAPEKSLIMINLTLNGFVFLLYPDGGVAKRQTQTTGLIFDSRQHHKHTL